MNCIYCELEFPKCELQPHLDYCGSRTEPCAKCGAYIMLKDQTKHEEENCRKPQPVPKTSTNQARADHSALRSDPYDFGAMSRALNRAPGQYDLGYDLSNINGGAAAGMAAGVAVSAGRDNLMARKPRTEKTSAFKTTNVKSNTNNRKKGIKIFRIFQNI